MRSMQQLRVMQLRLRKGVLARVRRPDQVFAVGEDGLSFSLALEVGVGEVDFSGRRRWVGGTAEVGLRTFEGHVVSCLEEWEVERGW